MGHIKSFNEFINESFSIDSMADDIYSILDTEYSGNFLKPVANAESPYLTSILDAFNIGYSGDIYEIRFNENNVFDNEDYTYYQIFVADNAPIDPNRNVYSSLWIEYGELGYTDGAEPWCLYYNAKKDKWISNESKSTWQYNENLMNLIMNITPVVNPSTKYVK